MCRWQVQVSVYCAWRIPAHGYLIPNVYLFMADIAKSRLVGVCFSEPDLSRHHPIL